MKAWNRLLVFFIALIFSSCGSGGGGGGILPIPGGGTPTFTNGEGSAQQPVGVNLDVSRPSHVGNISNSYYTFTTGVAGTYVISLKNPTVDVSWDLYSDVNFSTTVTGGHCDEYWSAATESCAVALDAGKTYFLEVMQWGLSGGTFTLEITLLGNDGSSGSPITLTVGTPYHGSVETNGKSYYRFKPSVSGAHTVAISNSVAAYFPAVTLNIYSDPAFTTTVTSCGGENYNPSCVANGLVADNYYYVRVDGDVANAVQYTITVTRGQSEGSKTAPFELIVDDPVHNGTVDASASSYYQFTTTETAGEYIVNVSQFSVIYAYSGADFSSGSIGMMASSGQPLRLYGLDARRPYYLQVLNSTASAMTYSIGVSHGNTEGSPNDPVQLIVDGPAHNSTIDMAGNSYYSFQTTSFSGSYTVSLTNTQKDLEWIVSDSQGYVWTYCNSGTSGDEICAVPNIDSNRTYYIKVTNRNSSASSTFSIAVATGGGSEGSRNTPVSLVTGSVHAGTVLAGGDSYYKFTTGSSAVTHVGSLTNMLGDLDWWLYSDAGFSYSVVWCHNQSGGTSDEICSTQNTSMPVLNPNTTYYLKVDSNDALASTYNILVDALNPAAGCSPGAAECFNFENGAKPVSFVDSSTGTKGQSWKWDADLSSAASGTYSLKSGSLSGGQSSCFEYSKTMTTGTLLFSVKTSAGYYDQAVFYIDGIQRGGWTATTAWRRVQYSTTDLMDGSSHTFKWCFEKDSGVAGAAAWVDDIEFR